MRVAPRDTSLLQNVFWQTAIFVLADNVRMSGKTNIAADENYLNQYVIIVMTLKESLHPPLL